MQGSKKLFVLCMYMVNVLTLLVKGDCQDDRDRLERQGVSEAELPFCEEDGTYSKVQCVGFL